MLASSLAKNQDSIYLLTMDTEELIHKIQQTLPNTFV